MRTPSQQIIDRKLVESFSYDAETGLVRRKKTAVYHIGAFDNVEDAKNARLSKANELHGEFSADRP